MTAEEKHSHKNLRENILPKMGTTFIRTKTWNICASCFQKMKLLLLNKAGHGNERTGQN